MQFQYSKEGLTQILQDNLAKKYKRKRLNLNAGGDSKPLESQNIKDDDMDLQGSEEEHTESPVILPQPRPGPVDESNMNVAPDEESSLLELERKQEELRRALEDACSDSNSNSNSIPSDPNVDGNEKMTETETTQTESDINQTDNETTQTSLINGENTINDSISEMAIESIENVSIVNESIVSVQHAEVLLSTPSPSVTGRSRESVVGTPLIKQVSPYTKLPIGDKWSIGVTDVIDFENLPDSTGTYQKLTGVIKKVRTVIKQINDDSDHDSS